MSVHGRPVCGARECSRHMDSCRPEACSVFTFSRWDLDRINPHAGTLSLSSSSQGNVHTFACTFAFYFVFFVCVLAAAGAPLSARRCARDKGQPSVKASSSFACFAFAFEWLKPAAYSHTRRRALGAWMQDEPWRSQIWEEIRRVHLSGSCSFSLTHPLSARCTLALGLFWRGWKFNSAARLFVKIGHACPPPEGAKL